MKHLKVTLIIQITLWIVYLLISIGKHLLSKYGDVYSSVTIIFNWDIVFALRIDTVGDQLKGIFRNESQVFLNWRDSSTNTNMIILKYTSCEMSLID